MQIAGPDDLSSFPMVTVGYLSLPTQASTLTLGVKWGHSWAWKDFLEVVWRLFSYKGTEKRSLHSPAQPPSHFSSVLLCLLVLLTKLDIISMRKRETLVIVIPCPRIPRWQPCLWTEGPSVSMSHVSLWKKQFPLCFHEWRHGQNPSRSFFFLPSVPFEEDEWFNLLRGNKKVHTGSSRWAWAQDICSLRESTLF